MAARKIEEAVEATAMSDEYINNTSPRGLVLILSQRFYDDPKLRSDDVVADAAKLKITFSEMDYIVEEAADLTVRETFTMIENICSDERMEEMSCMMTFILSHGDYSTTFLVSDGRITMEDILPYFTDERCPQMKGKPKFFFCQFCRGAKTSHDLNITGRAVTNWARKSIAQPSGENYNDTMCIYSSQSGFVSWVHPSNGSPFIDALCKTLEDKGLLWQDEFLSAFDREYLLTWRGQPMEVQYLNFTKKFRFNSIRQIRYEEVRHGDMIVQTGREIIRSDEGSIMNFSSSYLYLMDDNVVTTSNTLRRRELSCVSIYMKRNPIQFHDEKLSQILCYIANKGYPVESFVFQHLFRNPDCTIRGTFLEEPIQQIMKSCHVEDYQGSFISSMSLPTSIKKLHVSVSNSESYRALLRQLSRSLQQLSHLDICINVGLDSANLTPLPKPSNLSLHLPEIQDWTSASSAADITKRLEPENGFTCIHLPRLKLDSNHLEQFVLKLKGIKVSVISFPSYVLNNAEERAQIEEFIKSEMQCKVWWGFKNINEW